MEYKPGDIVTLKVLEVINGLVTFEIVGDGQRLHLITEQKPYPPPSMEQWRRDDAAFRKNGTLPGMPEP